MTKKGAPSIGRNRKTATDGTAITAYAELNYNFKNSVDPLYSRYGLEVKKMFASESKRAILVVRGELQATLGTDVPFYEQSSLGGQNNLRGFGVDRYIDKQLIAFSVEERIHILRTRLAGVIADFEIAPFIDTGAGVQLLQECELQRLPYHAGHRVSGNHQTQRGGTNRLRV
ncbi:MAG: BamA/TamA family outer membrane protein [Nitrospira sp.]|nr:BamA/TamA family outer membrane protein [Nitrospira sp.]